MLKKSLFVGTFFLLFIGLSDYGYGCHGGKPPHGDCAGGGGGGGGGGLTINLTGGTFVLDDPLPVNLNKKGNGATSTEDLDMTRPNELVDELLAGEWDRVFNECRKTLASLEIPAELHFGDDDWKIAAGAGDIRLRLFDARLEMNTVITLELRGDPFNYDGNPVPPDDGEISQFVIDGWVMFGDMEKGVTPRDSCKLSGGLDFPSTLTICGADAEDDNSDDWKDYCITTTPDR